MDAFFDPSLHPSFIIGQPLQGVSNVMSDGTKVVTEVVSNDDKIHMCLFLITQNIRDEKDMVVGFDTEWSLVQMMDGKFEARIVLIKLFSCIGCVLIRLDSNPSPSLQKIFMMKDIIFVGVQMKHDVMKLKQNFGIEVRNAVELSELAANVLGQPRLVAYGARDLASEVLGLGLDQRPMGVIWLGWGAKSLTPQQTECATVDAYVTYKTGKKLLSS